MNGCESKLHSTAIYCNNNCNSTLNMLNLQLLTDSKAHNIRKQRYIIIKPETSKGLGSRKKTETRPENSIRDARTPEPTEIFLTP